MSEPDPPPVWGPRPQGRRLAHHLVPAFVLMGFLLVLTAGAVVLDRLVYAPVPLALAIAVGLAIYQQFGGRGAYQEPELHPLHADGGHKAATRFGVAGASKPLAWGIAGLGVVTAVASLALVAKYWLLHESGAQLPFLAGSIVLFVVAILVIRRGLIASRIAAHEQSPGLYLTQRRVTLIDARGETTMLWKNITAVTAEDPPGRRPLGRRGPAFIVFATAEPLHRGRNRLQLPVMTLLSEPNQVFRALQYYLAHVQDRSELGRQASISRLTQSGR